MYDSRGGARYCIDDGAEKIIRSKLTANILTIAGNTKYNQIKGSK
jgi:hypothetical protein